LEVGAEAGAGGFFLEFTRLFFEFAGAFFEEFLLGIQLAVDGDEPVLPEVAEPLAEAEVGEVEEADEIEGQVDQGGAQVAEMTEDQPVEHESNVAAGAGGADIGGEGGEEFGVLVDIEPAGAAEEEEAGPDPVAMEIIHGLDEVAEAEATDQDGDEVSGGAEDEKGEPAGPGAGEADPIMNDWVGGGGGGGDIVGIVRDEGDKKQQGKAGEGDTDNVGKTTRGALD
jgi:hypothetical protein